MISVICVYNNRKTLDDYLLRDIYGQGCQLILLDNRGGHYSSAAEALNHGASEAEGEYLLFVHQDMLIGDESRLFDLENMLDELPDLGIAGLAGRRGPEGVITNITHGDPERPAGEMGLNEATVVETLDECLFIIPRQTFENHPFDEVTCDGWHLYAVDYCLNIENEGLKAYVLPFEAHHLSDGKSMSKDYYTVMARLIRKYKGSHAFIYTTMGCWDTRRPVILQRIHGFIRGSWNHCLNRINRNDY